MPFDTATVFKANAVVALRAVTESGRLEISFSGSDGTEHVVSLPLSAAYELAAFIADVSKFMGQLEKQSSGSTPGSA
jgi:hypothetical protein